MKRVPVTSSNVAEIGYDENRQILEVLFNNGSLYQYFDVPRRVFDEILQSGSIGQYLNSLVKGVYRYARV